MDRDNAQSTMYWSVESRHAHSVGRCLGLHSCWKGVHTVVGAVRAAVHLHILDFEHFITA
jgi:hypothetical protein